MGVKLALFYCSFKFLVCKFVTTDARAPKFKPDCMFGVEMEICSLNYFLAEFDFVRFPALFRDGLHMRRFMIWADWGGTLESLEPIWEEHFEVRSL